jgi:hypothetical protein
VEEKDGCQYGFCLASIVAASKEGCITVVDADLPLARKLQAETKKTHDRALDEVLKSNQSSHTEPMFL